MRNAINPLLVAIVLTTVPSVVLIGGEAEAEAGNHAGDYGTTYETKNGTFVVRRTTKGWQWEAANGEGGTTTSKRQAKKDAKASLEENPA